MKEIYIYFKSSENKLEDEGWEIHVKIESEHAEKALHLLINHMDIQGKRKKNNEKLYYAIRTASFFGRTRNLGSKVKG